MFPGLISPEPHIIINDLDAGTEFDLIEFYGDGYQLSGNSFATSGGIQLDGVALTIDVGTSATMQIDGSIDGTGEITKSGDGELILNTQDPAGGSTTMASIPRSWRENSAWAASERPASPRLL